MPQNIILNSLKQSLISIWKNKSLFVLLFILQVVFFIIFSVINLTYQAKILTNIQAITSYLSQQKLDEASATANLLQQKSLLGDDPLLISRNFNEMVKNFRLYLIYAFILLVIFISMAWVITHRLSYKFNSKQFAKNFFNIFLVLLFYLGLIFLFFFSLLNISVVQLATPSQLLIKYVPFFIFSVILAYFMFVSLSLSHYTELKNIVQKTLSIGIRKMRYILAAYFINIFLFIMPIILLYYFIEKNLFILILSLMLMIFSFVFGRIFMVSVVEKLE